MSARNAILRLSAIDADLSVRSNRLASQALARFFAGVSRLGDGGVWYVVLLALPLWRGEAGWRASLHMAVVGAAGFLLYKALKRWIARPRPYAAHGSIVLLGAPLDRYSFPSGHTLHAVAFTSIACSHFPELAWLLVPFALLVALSRVVLGLHYPSDVLAGALLGAALAALSLL